MKKFIKDNGIYEWIFITLIPCVAPLISLIPDIYISANAKNIMLALIAIFSMIISIIILRKKQKKIKLNNTNEITAFAYTSAYKTIQNKRNRLLQRTYDNKTNSDKINSSENILPYNVHDYIEYICYELNALVSQITSINYEYLSVSFIYRYSEDTDKNDTNWKWITGKEIETKLDLNDFVNYEHTVYYQLINSKKKYIYIDDKKIGVDLNQYHMGNRDKSFNGIGSIFSTKINFSNNGKVFVHGILTISSYGEKFTSNIQKESLVGNDFKNLFIYRVLPYYEKLIQTELGYMYFRHISKNNIIK